ncbi:MAG: hypothetical protein PV344_04400, partial [Anaplasma sp.]|nr:hypothetical protein [Anaplasma sp.]
KAVCPSSRVPLAAGFTVSEYCYFIILFCCFEAVVMYTPFTPKLTARSKVRVLRANQSPASYRVTPLSAREYAERV